MKLFTLSAVFVFSLGAAASISMGAEGVSDFDEIDSARSIYLESGSEEVGSDEMTSEKGIISFIKHVKPGSNQSCIDFLVWEVGIPSRKAIDGCGAIYKNN